MFINLPVDCSEDLIPVCGQRRLEECGFVRRLAVFLLQMPLAFGGIALTLNLAINVLGIRFGLLLVKSVDFELRPREVSLLVVLLQHPPKPPLDQTFDEEGVVARTHVHPILLLIPQRSVVLQHNGVVLLMRHVEHKQKLAVGAYLLVVNGYLFLV